VRPRWKQQVGRAIVSRSDTPLGRRAERVAGTIHALLRNDSADLEVNGERWLCEALAAGAPEVVWDVGANKGDWARVARQAMPTARIRSFEPLPEPFAALERLAAGDNRIQAVNAALSDSAGTLELWRSPRHDTLTSAVHPGHDDAVSVHVDCRVGDEEVVAAGIDRIDLLKIDVEGHDMEVLHGFDATITAGRVAVVRFEFTLWAAKARRWLADYVDWFEERGYTTGKLMPRSVDFRPYDAADEVFLRCNFVAVRPDSDEARLLGAG